MKTFVLLLTIAFVAFPKSVTAQTDDKARYIGYKYKGLLFDEKLPSGWKNEGGGLLTGVDAEPTYSISQWSKPRMKMLWLEIAIGKDKDKGVTEWQVKDVLILPNLSKNQTIIPFGEGCERNKKSEANLTVLADFAPKTRTYKVLEAWKANLKTEKFEKISITGIKCFSIGP